MARLIYGGTPADFTISLVTVNDSENILRNVAGLAGSITMTAWNASSGGTQLTDLLDESATPITQVTSDAQGRLAPFFGPDGYQGDVWVADPVSGRRYRLSPAGVALRLATAEQILADNTWLLNTAQSFTATKTALLPNDMTSAFVIRQDNTVTATGSKDLFVIYHKGTDDSHRAGWFNEWGGLRIRTPTTAELGYGDVCVKLFQRNSGQDILQMFGSASESVPTWRLREKQQYGGAADWQTFSSYVNGYSAYAGTTYYTPKGRVQVGGDECRWKGRIVADGSTVVGETMFAVPSDLRPARTVQVDAVNSAGSVVQLDVNPDGTVVMQRALSITWLSLDNCIYYKGAD